MTAGRYLAIPRQWWGLMSRPVRLLATDLEAVEAAISAGGGVLAELPAGTTIAVRPNPQGTWAGVLENRVPGAVYWWQRAITPTTNAPVPTAGDGFVVGDMVDGLGGGGEPTVTDLTTVYNNEAKA